MPPMTVDPRVQSAIAHWAPRFVANGVPLTDFQDVTAGLERWDDWCPAWAARAAIHEAMGREALAAGNCFSAGQHLTTAAVCYHFGKFLFVNDVAEMRRVHRLAIECRRLALPHIRPPGEEVEIPYLGGVLAGILRKPDGVARPPGGGARAPIVVMCMGLDSAKEEMGAYEQLFLDRGMATLSFDGPGQGEAEYDLPIRPDYEVPVGAVFDCLETRDDIDPSRIGLWGVSLGGYFAPRAAAFEKRARGCIALSGPYDWGAIWDHLPGLTRAAFIARTHSASDDQARAVADTMSLDGVAENITCPLFVVAGKLDELIPWQQAERLASEAAGPVELLVIEDGNHVANNRGYRYRAQSADWMAGVLAG
jgi:pimeloyl-ACP methyl ester carboxylesterase